MHEALARRLGRPLPDAYRARLDHELRVLRRRGWIRRFEAAAVVARTARDHGVLLGPGLGTLPSSLVAFALGITAVDPLRYGLVFERWVPKDGDPTLDLDVERTAQMPDWCDAMADDWPGRFELEVRGEEGALLMTFEPDRSPPPVRLRGLPILDTFSPFVCAGELDLDAVDLDECARTAARFRRTTFGEEPEFQRFVVELAPARFEHLVAALALWRPGPIDLTPQFLARRHGHEAVTYPHPATESLLRDTYGLALYQEQVIGIAHDVAGLSLGEANQFRRALGRKSLEDLDRWRPRFVDGVIAHAAGGRDAAERLYEWVRPFADYAMNRSHVVACGMLTAWTLHASRTLGSCYARAFADASTCRQRRRRCGCAPDMPPLIWCCDGATVACSRCGNCLWPYRA